MSDDEKPFRIPRKERDGSRGLGRSSVVHAPGHKTDPPHGYGRPIVPMKRKATSSTEVGGQKQRRQRDGSKDSPVETILQSMIQAKKPPAPPPKEKEKDDTQPPTPTKFKRTGSSSLTKEKVERHSSLQECYSFGKKGLMEALLEHKMRTGRIDPHTEIGLSLNYRPSVDPFHPEKLKPPEKAPVPSPPRKGPRTPPGTPPSPSPPKAKKGPATPPDSPPPNSSSDSKSPSFRGRSDDSESVTDFVNRAETQPSTAKSHPSPEKPAPPPPAAATSSASLTPKPRPPKLSESQPAPDQNKEVLEKLARMARVDVDHLKNCLNPDVLATLKQLDSSVLLATVSTVLSTLAQTVSKVGKGSEGQQEVTSSSVSPKVLPPQSAALTTEPEALVSSTGMKDESVEMDLESDHEDPPTVQEESWRQPEHQQFLEQSTIEMTPGQVPIMRVDLTRKGQPSTSETPQAPPPQVPVPPQPAPPPLPIYNPVSAPGVIPTSSTGPAPSVPNPNPVQMIHTLLNALAIPPRPTLSAPQLPLPPQHLPPTVILQQHQAIPPQPTQIRFNVPPPSAVDAVVAQIRPEIRCSTPSPAVGGGHFHPPPPNVHQAGAHFQRLPPPHSAEPEFPTRTRMAPPPSHHMQFPPRHFQEPHFFEREPNFQNDNHGAGPPPREFFERPTPGCEFPSGGIPPMLMEGHGPEEEYRNFPRHLVDDGRMSGPPPHFRDPRFQSHHRFRRPGRRFHFNRGRRGW